ncbi:zinc finger BED domain-containing 4-like [Brachionus plicatilis]|uniref:Zinc finger BED domain-containing 4-like n=1 Tax=Brachionus plicatilis TaxID=10195 RepID=A0A3M7QNH3_BRAPC|nr:zinc finger BED domain-containing 4-like [Brachionus plicatilis]
MIIGRGVQKKTKLSQPSLPKQHPRILSNFDFEKSAIERPWENFTATYLVSLLEPFHDLTIDLQKDFGSISIVYPAFKGLLKHINQIKTKPDLKDMADELDRSLKSRFSFVETNPVYVVATLLNPSFSFLFNDPEESLFYERVLKEQFLNYIRPQSNI